MDIKQYEQLVARSDMKHDVRMNILKQMNRVKSAMEAVDLGVGYSLEDTEFGNISTESGEKIAKKRMYACDAMLNNPWAIKPRGAIHHYSLARGFDIRSENDDLQSLIKTTLNAKVSNAFDAKRNIDRELGNGALAYNFVHMGGRLVAIREMDVSVFDRLGAVKSPINPSQVWMHRTSTERDGMTHVYYYPDACFFADDGLRNSLEQEIIELEKVTEAKVVKFEWDSRVMYHEFNHGVPLFYALALYIRCIDAIIGLQSAVLQSVAYLATYAEIGDEQERWDARDQLQQLQQLAAGGGSVTDKVGAINDAFTAGTAVTSGKISTVNLTIAMLQDSSALYQLTTHSVYNSVPGLEATDWSEVRRYSLGDQGSQQNTVQVLSGLLRQEEHGNIFKEMMETVISILVFAGVFLDGITVQPIPINVDGKGVATYLMIDYIDDADIVVSWPEITTKNVLETVEAMGKAFTLDGRIGKPLGKPSDYVRALATVGIHINLDTDDWEDYRLGQSLVMQRTNQGARDEGVTSQSSEALVQRVMEKLDDRSSSD